MRTTITFEDDVAAAIADLQREQGVGISTVVNDLVRAGLQPRPRRAPFEQKTARLGLRVDVDNIAEVLDLLDESA